ncbi:hypothetical protein JCM4914_36050 [Streptomyces platensis subsp. malvinus]
MTTTPDTTSSILIVDDMEENLVALEAVLGSLTQKVVRARSGEEALKAMLREEFAVVLIDVLMPGMNGFETAANIKGLDQTKDVPIILLTGASVDPNYAYRGYTVGAADFLIKPFDPWLLRTKVNVFLDLHRKNRQLAAQAEQLKRLLTKENRPGGAETEQATDTSAATSASAPTFASPPASASASASTSTSASTSASASTATSAEARGGEEAQGLEKGHGLEGDHGLEEAREVAETQESPAAAAPTDASAASAPSAPPAPSAPSARSVPSAEPKAPEGTETAGGPPEGPVPHLAATTAPTPGEAAHLADIAGQLADLELLLRDASTIDRAHLADRIAELEQAVGRLLVNREP